MAAIEQDNSISPDVPVGDSSDMRRRSRERLRTALRTFRRLGLSELPKETVHALGAQLGSSSTNRPSTAIIDALEQMSLAVTITDANATILYANSRFEQLSGYTLEELIGQKQSINSNKMTPLTIYKKMWQTILAGQTWNGRLLNRRKDGETYVVDLTITPIRADTGEVTYFLGIHDDAGAIAPDLLEPGRVVDREDLHDGERELVIGDDLAPGRRAAAGRIVGVHDDWSR